jgi:hypothetical protein
MFFISIFYSINGEKGRKKGGGGGDMVKGDEG